MADYRKAPYCWLRHWMAELELDDWGWHLASISSNDVEGEDGSIGHELVGVIIYDDRVPHPKTFDIVHTRPLTEDDVIHELLHVQNPFWNEQKVEEETWRLYLKRKEQRRRA